MKPQYPLIIIALSCLLTACSKLTSNGKIDGKWRLEKMYCKPTDNALYYTEEKDLMAEQIYWNIQLGLLSITSADTLNGYSNETTARFTTNNNHFEITQTYIHYRDRDSLLTDPNITLLEPIGIRSNACQYTIPLLTSSKMILCSEKDSLIFYKLH